jgi:hypothetical protein
MKGSDLVSALGPAFAAGLAVQQMLELLDAVLPESWPPGRKKRVMQILAFLFGLLVGALDVMRVVSALTGRAPENGLSSLNGFVDWIVTALIISGGTEVFNALLKLLGYKKEEKKAEAARQMMMLSAESVRPYERMTAPVVPEGAFVDPHECINCIFGVLQSWSGSAPSGGDQTLKKLWESNPANGPCSSGSMKLLVSALNQARCGQQIPQGSLQCADTVGTVSQLVCGR